jgi:hypothetical protein
LSTSVHVLSGPLDEERRSELLFSGDLVVFKQVPAAVEVASAGDGLVREALGASNGTDEAAIAGLQGRFRRDSGIERLLHSALEQVGVVAARTYWDSLYLRIVPPAAKRQIGTIGFHRDTWSSNVLQQTNWWLTLRPLSAERTIAFYPHYWSKPIANTSANWNLDAFRQRRRRGEPTDDLPIVPEPSEPVNTDSELRMVIEPGDLLCFSGAHLHASVPNTSGETRCSVELRTVNRDDFYQGRGAPDLDGRAPVTPLDWFHSMVDGEPLSRDVARYARRAPEEGTA